MNDTKVENNLNVDRTNLSMSVARQVASILATISFTAIATYYIITTTNGYSRDIQDLKDNKVSRYEYRLDKVIDSINNIYTQRKLDAIMQKLGVKDY